MTAQGKETIKAKSIIFPNTDWKGNFYLKGIPTGGLNAAVIIHS